MASRIWIETGGDTGGGEFYTSNDEDQIAHVDWDAWNEGEIEFDQVFEWLEEFGDVMPKLTRLELLSKIQERHYELLAGVETG